MSDIKVGVKAEFDQASVQAGMEKVIKQVEKTTAVVNRASKAKIDPFDQNVLKNFKQAEDSLRRYLALSQGVARRMVASGQTGVSSISQINFDQLYPGNPERARAARRAAMQFTGGGGGGPMPGEPGHWASAGRRVISSGLGAAGPGGRVVDSSLSAGMTSGIGAGIAGLLGGIVALGVGKAVGAVVNGVGEAQRNAMGLDTLKRTLGDVNVGFEALKVQLLAGARNIDVTFDESLRLGTSFAKLSGISQEQYKTLNDEITNAGGMARSFGLDPSQTTAFFAQMRRAGVTGGPQDSRDLALMVSEGVAKAGTFSKMDEVLDAISGFAASQTSSGMNAANVAGFTELFTGLTGSKRAGLDPSSAAALLGRVNSSIAAGGANGEAGQNFLYSALGSRLGLNPIQAKILQEQGAFGTGVGTFGAGSMYAEFAGKHGLGTPGAAKSGATNLELVKEKLAQIYKGQPELMVDAMANLFGVNISQAMALSSIDGKALGGLSSRLRRNGINVGDVNATGLSAIAQIEADGSLSEAEKDRRIKDAATQNQEKTEGSETRRTINGVQRAVEEMASQLLLPLNIMRSGIMLLAGEGKMSERQVLETMAGLDSKDRLGQIESQFEGKLKAAGKGRLDARQAIQALMETNRPKILSGEMTQEEHARQMKPLLEREQAAIKADTEAREWRRRAIEEEAALLEKTLAQARGEAPAGPSAGGGRGFVNPGMGGSGGSHRTYGSLASATSYDAMFAKYEQQFGLPPGVLKATALKENARMDPNAVGGMNGNGSRDYGLMQHNSKYLAGRGLSDSWNNPERSIEEAARLWKANLKASGGDVRGAARRYNGSGPMAEAYADSFMGIYGNGGTPMPAGAPAPGPVPAQKVDVRIVADPLRLMDRNGQVGQAALNARVDKPTPSGAPR